VVIGQANIIYRTSKYYLKGSYIGHALSKRIHGRSYYKVGANKYIRKSNARLKKSSVASKVNNSNNSSVSATVSNQKNAASFMSFLASQKSLSAAQRSEARTAAKLLRTGSLSSQSAPSWFNKYVKLGAAKDATSAANLKASIQDLENANSARAKVGSRRLKVSPILTAISMIDADYQKQGGVHHPQYYKYEDSLESISAGSEPITIWMTEKNNWKEDVRKNSSLKSLEFHPNWDNQAYTDAVMGAHGYKVAGHYTNLVNRNHRIMGMAHMTDNNYGYADVYNASSKNNKGSLTLGQYKSLVNRWLNR
jgi:hypothetical protein